MDRIRLISTIFIANMNNAALAGSRLAVPLVALELGASKLMVGAITAMFTAVPMVTSVRFGRWNDRIGTRLPMVFCGGLILVAALGTALFPHLLSLVIAAALIGAGAVYSHIAATRAVGDLGDHFKRSQFLGYLAVGYSFFQFLGPLVTGLAYDYSGAQASFFVIAAMSLTGLLFLALPLHHFQSWTCEAVGTAGRLSLGKVVRRPLLRVSVLAYGTFSASITLFPLIAALHSVKIGLSAAEASFLLAAVAAGSAISRGGAAHLLRWFPSPAILTAALLVAALTFISLPLFEDLVPLLTISAMLGLSLGLGQPIAMSMIYEAAPKGQINESLGFALSLTNFLQLSAPLAMGVLAGRFGIAPMMWLLAAAMGFTALAIKMHARQ